MFVLSGFIFMSVFEEIGKKFLTPFLFCPPSELQEWLRAHDQPAFRGNQIWRWALKPGVISFDQMSDLPQKLRLELAEHFSLRTVYEKMRQGDSDSPAEKSLLELSDGESIETVLLHNAQGEHTLCVSTQVGCAMGCTFCATGLDGVVRNLTSGEILEQFLLASDLLHTRGERLSHAVIMGMGEPSANLEALLEALDVVSSPKGLNIGARKITISTVGIPTGIRRLADHPKAYHLAVSLHAPNDELRTSLIPANRRVGIENILHAADYYFAQTGRRVTYEYILLADVNDSPTHAQELARLLKKRNALVNLIPYNPVSDIPFRTPAQQRVMKFATILEKNGVQVVLRHRKGEKIEAACGQLRRKRRSS
ncbi:MAG: 23S rRNA (adenine(2503)-C(2))-methyltransferase RlmN [Planctomycetia bacterium]|nr:23S rRNA (adenine(2503)-C(2))-methyltransferase RlmN [Planctomycetia bacterium]